MSAEKPESQKWERTLSREGEQLIVATVVCAILALFCLLGFVIANL